MAVKANAAVSLSAGARVDFRRPKTNHTKLWVEYFRDKYGKGPYTILEVIPSVDNHFYRLDNSSGIAWSEDWLVITR